MVYLDHNATTPLDERVLEAMLPYLGKFFGNASALYRLGRLSRAAVEVAREQVAALAGAAPASVFFTSGGTEANNLAIKGMAFSREPGIAVLGGTEHPSVLEPFRFIARRGWRTETLPVDPLGQPDLALLDELPADALRFGSVMLANNETGTITDIEPIVERLRERGALLHCDGVQAAGKIPLDFRALGIQLLSVSSHKIYGPKGAGALIVDSAVGLEPLLHGGGQEHEIRGGTENVAAIVGFGKAAELALSELDRRAAHVRALRQRFETGLDGFPNVRVFASAAPRLPNTVQFGVEDYEGETLVMQLDRAGFAVSSGSACASGAGEPSPVLTAMGYGADEAKGAVRVSFGAGNSEADVDRLLEFLAKLAGSSNPVSRAEALRAV